VTGLQVGAASFSIDPPLPSDPQGFVRRAVAVRDALEPMVVRACVIQNESHIIAMLAADVTNLDTYFADRIRRIIHTATGIPYDNILLNSSHTHAGLWPRKGGEKLHGEFAQVTDAEHAYFERLPYDYASVVVKAITRMKPARISGGTGLAPGIAVNRRERDGRGGTILGWNKENFIDEEVPAIRIDGHDGAAIATLVGFGCHPVVLGGEVPYSGPDFIGELRRRVELLRGGVCIFFQGAAGNVLPLEAFFDQPGPEIAMGARLGLEAVHAIVDHDPRLIEIERIAYGSVTPIGLYRRRAVSPQPSQPIGSLRKVLNLPLNPAMTVSEMENELEKRKEDFDTKVQAGAGRDLLNPIGYHIAWLSEMLRMANIAPLPAAIEGEIWAARFGDTAVVGTPGELFSEIGAEVRRRSPFATTIFAGYCQGVLGYVATPEEYQFGGYEPTVAQRGYGHPAPFSPAASRMLIEESVTLLESLNAKSE
jgi:neutral ceramidase